MDAGRYNSFRAIPLSAALLAALAVHGPLLMMQLPTQSFDTNFHIFFASHYAHHWFDPWNEKWFAGFSQTTYPPLTHQWIALLSKLTGLTMAYMLVQLAAVLLLVAGVYRFARIWTGERAAGYAALGSVFLGALSFLVYQAGQLATVASAALLLHALPYFYTWSTRGSGAALVKGLLITIASAAAHHVTLLFGMVLFAGPVLWLACADARREQGHGRLAGALSRALMFGILAAAGIAVVLMPFWITLLEHPIRQMPIPHDSRNNYLFSSISGINYFLVPYGALLLLVPFIVLRGSAVARLRPLLVAFWVAFMLGLGGTTPLPRWLLGGAYEILTFERFTLWAGLLAIPIVGLVAVEWTARHRQRAMVGLALAAIASLALVLAWDTANPNRAGSQIDVQPVVSFLNRDGHDKYRFLTLGFGNSLAVVSTYANAGSVDGDYNSGRLLPEMTRYGSAQLTNSKFFGTAGMDSLRAMLQHADRYGLKYVFVHDPYYEPMLSFAGWRRIETYNNGDITVWSKDDTPPATTVGSDSVPAWEGVLWGTLPFGSSLLAIGLELLWPVRRRMPRPVPLPVTADDYVA